MNKKILLIIWLVLCGLVPLFVRWGAHDAEESFFLLMVMLTFPSGFLLAASLDILFGLLGKAGVYVPGNYVFYIVLWLLFAFIGYVQWFVIVPWIIRKFKKALPFAQTGAVRQHRGQRFLAFPLKQKKKKE
jgi:hypothetical protein